MKYQMEISDCVADFSIKVRLTLLTPLLLILLRSFNVSGQETRLPETIKNIAENLAAAESDEEAVASYLDRLYELSENPVDLNTSGAEELSRLFFLSDFQVKALIDYVQSTGKILSFNELSNIPGFDRSTSEMMIPFCTLTGREIPVTDSLRFRNLFFTNLSVRSGMQDSTSLGSSWRVLSKYRFNAERISGGITVEKDPGERFFIPGTINPDFISANIAYTGKGIVHKVVVGDYSAKFGQGLNINTGISTGLSLTTQGYMSATNEIRQYTSTDENAFFRGVASVLSFKKTELSLIYSYNNVDASLGSSTGYSMDFIDNFYRTGTHNTRDLLIKKDAISETTAGINMLYNFRAATIGITWSESRFSLPVKKDSNDLQKLFAFGGQSVNTWSFFYNAMIKRILVYGEFSANDVTRYAIVQGLSFRPSDRLAINLLYWKYSNGYTAFHGRGPGGSSGNYSEESLLGNFNFEAARHLFISGGFLMQRFPWLRYRCSSPATGLKREIRINYLATDKLTFDCLYSYRLSENDNSELKRIPDLKQVISRSFKFVARYSPMENLTVGTRIDYKYLTSPVRKGMLLLEDLILRVRPVPLTIWLRFCIFSTDDYDSRIYTWENDLLYTYSIPSFSGKGSRFYFMAGWKIHKNAELRIKYGILSKSGTSYGFTDTEEFKLQLKVFI